MHRLRHGRETTTVGWRGNRIRQNRRPAGVCFSQDRSILAGSVGSAHAEKIAYVIQTARKLGVPLIGLNDSAGARIQEGLSVTSAIGKIFFENSIASGCIPQISAIMGPCIGVGSYSPALTDFILMVQNSSQMFITGPAVIKEVLGETVTMEELGGAKIHSEVSGVTDLVAKNDEECLAMIRRLLGFLPSSFESPPPHKPNPDDPNRPVDLLEKIVPEDPRRAYNILQVIKAIVDDGDFLELERQICAQPGHRLWPAGRSPGRVRSQPADVSRRQSRRGCIGQGRSLYPFL